MVLISLYTSRVNLQALGIENKGIFEVVGGTIALFSFLNSSLSGATSRFLTFEIGKGNKKRLADTFATALNFHIIVAIIVVIFAETIGLWFIECKAVIPEERMFAAHVAYQLAIISTVFSLTQVPYNATLIAHERMGVFAYMTILEALLRLLICYLLFVSPFDKLITMAVLSLLVGICMVMVYRIYCVRHFEECHFKIVKDMSIIKPMFAYSGWVLFGNFAVMGRTQGVSLLLNTFFGPVVNAAVSFSNAISGTLTGFTNNFMTAIRPPIVKAYAQGEYERMQTLMASAAKYSFALLMVLSLPFIFETQFILELWLKTPPQWTALLCKWELALALFSTFCLPLMFSIHATGQVKRMSIMNGFIIIMVLPLSYLLLLNNLNPAIPFILKLILQVFVFGSYIYNLKRNMPEFEPMRFFKDAVIPCVIAITLVVIPTMGVRSLIHEDGWLSFLITGTTTTLLSATATYFILFDKEMRHKAIAVVKSKLHI